MKEIYDLITVGAGASGMIASVRAAERCKKVLLLEKGDRSGRKILASGNGRCNLMNKGELRYNGDQSFALEVLTLCPVQRINEYFRHLGLMTYEESEGRIYPYSNQSATVLNILKTNLEVYDVRILTNHQVTDAHYDGDVFSVTVNSGELFYSKKLLIACGGEAQARLGGSADGYHLLRSFGHSIVPTSPALVPLETDKRSISGLSGIRIRCDVHLLSHDDLLLHREEGEVLFTEYGVSGICIMQCARFIRGDCNRLELDFLHRLGERNTEMIEELKRRQAVFKDMSPTSLLEGILPGKIAYAVLKQAGIPLKGEQAGELTADDLMHIVHAATHYRIQITGTRGFDYAQVTAGGALCSEFDPCTMESKIVPGLFAAGEVLNVDGDCGGYNLMFAFASGMNAGEKI